MRGRNAIIAVLLSAVAANAETGSFDGLKASASVTADASGRFLGERFAVPAASSRASSKSEDDLALSDSINFWPDLALLSGVAGASYSTSVHGNVISGAATSAIAVSTKKDNKNENELLLTTSSSVTYNFNLLQTVAADLSMVLSCNEGFGKVRTSLSGPLTQPMLDLEESGDMARTLILPPGAYRLTFTHLTAAGVESDSDELDAEAKGSASFTLAVDPCGADCNGDNKLDILDFICFQQRIEDGAKAADLNQDGKFDILDMVVFQNLFVGGGCD